ncbi:hypothetical protein AWW66_25125 [Micromonospora rosaria]|uniref:Uncharacterized protein n=1 Tax=Micromonospora rosaria TaxID=47874 RepID=A0A136PLC7_9ACTN|nr:hypothetical protein [Micromonospora rosaria]KXK59280.1 hypothetical protein AWW66_25125 [Micromonospora rosaria]
MISQTAVLTAALYYFGWIRAHTTYSHFGVDPQLLGFSVTDYLMRSVNSVLPPLIVTGFLVLALRAAHRHLVLPMITTLSNQKRQLVTQAVVTARGIAALLATVTVIGLLAEEQVGAPLGPALPLTMIAATALLGYAGHLSTLIRQQPKATSDASSIRLRTAALLALAIIGLFWAVSSYAQHTGRAMAADRVAGLPNEPDLVLYSAERLAIAGPGITVDEIRQENSRFRYRYAGLRLLVHSPDRYALVPAHWERGNSHVHLIPISADVRIDLIAR